jgi:hypothetical protein
MKTAVGTLPPDEPRRRVLLARLDCALRLVLGFRK